MCAWKSNYDTNGERGVYNDDNERIGTEYNQIYDSNLKDTGSSTGAVPRGRQTSSSGADSLVAQIVLPIISLALRYAPFLALAWYLSKNIIPKYFPGSPDWWIVWGIGGVVGIIAALLVRYFFRIVFSRSTVLLLPFKILLFIVISGLQFIVFGGFIYSIVSGTNALPSSIQDLSTRDIIGIVVGVIAGVFIAMWVWHRWNHSVFGERI